MLLLSRKAGEQIMIGPNVTVTVMEIQGDRVRLAFDAPHHIPIHREEVYLRIHAEAQKQDLFAVEQFDQSPYHPEFA
jgi:carbon storage regulator